jgi:predicted ester cyclase
VSSAALPRGRNRAAKASYVGNCDPVAGKFDLSIAADCRARTKAPPEGCPCRTGAPLLARLASVLRLVCRHVATGAAMSRQMRRNVMTETATQAKSSTSPIDVARSFFAAYNAHDVERMVAACSEDAGLRYVPMGSQGRGNARELGKSIWSGRIDAFPDLAVTVESIFGDERNVAAEVVIGGTQQKDFLQIRSQGRHYDFASRVPVADE